MKKIICLTLSGLFVYSSVAVPVAQASLWAERRKYAESLQSSTTLKQAPIREVVPRQSAKVSSQRLAGKDAPMIIIFRMSTRTFQPKKTSTAP